jgi:acyl carrier protein
MNLEMEVRTLVAAQLRRPIDDVQLGTRLSELVFDSLDLLEVVVELQEELDVIFEEVDIDAVETIGDVVALIGKRRSEQIDA